MISVEHARTMARYNQWQNRSLYSAADGLTDAERRKDRGAFFGSIHGTLSHVLWGDRQWMSRFKPDIAPPGIPNTQSPSFVADWEELKVQRSAFDQIIIDWTDQLHPDWLCGNLTWYSGAAKAEMVKPRWFLLTHFFNHETHHRGQVHAMLTQAGAKPDDTDLMLMKL